MSGGAPPLRTVELYEKVEKIGQGAYGEVYSARARDTSAMVALKKVRLEHEKEGFPITAIREIKILRALDHPNVVRLVEIVASPITAQQQHWTKSNVYLVFELMNNDLAGLIQSSYSKMFTAGQIKGYMLQMLEGVSYLHNNNIIHRDIKPSNLFLSQTGHVKLGDFGLSRSMVNKRAKTPTVVTLWYRAPELLLGDKSYGPGIDVWACACVMAELLCHKPIFPGSNETTQVRCIWKLCGSPMDRQNNWLEARSLPHYPLNKPQTPIPRQLTAALRRVVKQVAWATDDLCELMDRMLTLNPAKRISSTECLTHAYFWVDEPEAMKPEQMPKYPACYEMTARQPASKRSKQSSGR